jgi:hypothetical protein
MSFDRQHGRLSMLCDYCGEPREAEADVDACSAFFDAFIEGAKAEGWQIANVGGKWHGAAEEWLHVCPDCGEHGP